MPIAEKGGLSKAHFEDHITLGNGGIKVQSPGVNKIPPFQRLHGKPSRSAPPMPKPEDPF
jgi:hypothetical protein